MNSLSTEDAVSIHNEVWPFLEDVALSIETAASEVFKIVLESPLYVPIVKERLRRLGYDENLERLNFLKVGHPIPHVLRIEVRPVKS